MPNPYQMPGADAESDTQNAVTQPGIMETFRTRVEKFWNTYTQLEQRDDVPDNLRDEYDSLMDRGGRIRATIENITNTYDAVADWVGDWFGFNGAEGLDAFRWSDLRGSNLGAIPFVPIAVITGASAFIVKWLKDAYTFERKITEHKRLMAQGYDGQRAAEIVNKTVSGPGLLNFKANMKPILILGGLGVGIWYANRKGWI